MQVCGGGGFIFQWHADVMSNTAEAGGGTQGKMHLLSAALSLLCHAGDLGGGGAASCHNNKGQWRLIWGGPV